MGRERKGEREREPTLEALRPREGVHPNFLHSEISNPRTLQTGAAGSSKFCEDRCSKHGCCHSPPCHARNLGPCSRLEETGGKIEGRPRGDRSRISDQLTLQGIPWYSLGIHGPDVSAHADLPGPKFVDLAGTAARVLYQLYHQKRDGRSRDNFWLLFSWWGMYLHS